MNMARKTIVFATGNKGKLAEAQDALGVLGYNRTEIAQVLREIDVTGLSLEQIITAALRRFSEK